MCYRRIEKTNENQTNKIDCPMWVQIAKILFIHSFAKNYQRRYATKIKKKCWFQHNEIKFVDF